MFHRMHHVYKVKLILMGDYVKNSLGGCSSQIIEISHPLVMRWWWSRGTWDMHDTFVFTQKVMRKAQTDFLMQTSIPSLNYCILSMNLWKKVPKWSLSALRSIKPKSLVKIISLIKHSRTAKDMRILLQVVQAADSWDLTQLCISVTKDCNVTSCASGSSSILDVIIDDRSLSKSNSGLWQSFMAGG